MLFDCHRFYRDNGDMVRGSDIRDKLHAFRIHVAETDNAKRTAEQSIKYFDFEFTASHGILPSSLFSV